MAWDISTGPGVTALGLAAARLVESGRSDRLIEDPYARVLFAAAGSELPTRVDWPESGTPVSDTEALHLHGSRYIGLQLKPGARRRSPRRRSSGRRPSPPSRRAIRRG